MLTCWLEAISRGKLRKYSRDTPVRFYDALASPAWSRSRVNEPKSIGSDELLYVALGEIGRDVATLPAGSNDNPYWSRITRCIIAKTMVEASKKL